MKLKNCLNCHQEFDRPLRSNSPFKIAWVTYRKRKFCSSLCSAVYSAKLGSENGMWKGGKSSCIDCKIILAARYNHRQINPRCRACYAKFMQVPENNPNFREKLTDYIYLHTWVKRQRGKAVICEFCNSTFKVEWANKTGNYLKDISDWIPLCKPCHGKYDKENNLRNTPARLALS